MLKSKTFVNDVFATDSRPMVQMVQMVQTQGQTQKNIFSEKKSKDQTRVDPIETYVDGKSIQELAADKAFQRQQDIEAKQRMNAVTEVGG